MLGIDLTVYKNVVYCSVDQIFLCYVPYGDWGHNTIINSSLNLLKRMESGAL